MIAGVERAVLRETGTYLLTPTQMIAPMGRVAKGSDDPRDHRQVRIGSRPQFPATGPDSAAHSPGQSA
jgi:hypothetical protein